VLLAAEGVANHDIAAQAGVSRPTVNRWRSRYAAHGMAGLSDAKHPGPPRRVNQSKIITETLKPPPPSLGVMHWSSRLLTGRVGVDHATVAAKDYGVRPWRAETFKFSTDPELVAKVTDIIGLYLHPPENAIVLCVDEKSQIQALNRTQKMLPMQPGHDEQRTHGYVRHGTTTLFAALEVATGQVTGLCQNRHRHQELLLFLKHVARAYPGRELHLVMDNYATHKRPEIKAWLAANLRIHVCFTPTSGSWLNLLEVWFASNARPSGAVTANTGLFGPRMPTMCSPKSNVNVFQRQTTRHAKRYPPDGVRTASACPSLHRTALRYPV